MPYPPNVPGDRIDVPIARRYVPPHAPRPAVRSWREHRMKPRLSVRRWTARGGTAVLAAAALAAGLQAAAPGAQAAVGGRPATANPYSPAYHHAYRGGVVPTRPQLAKMRAWARSHPAQAAAASPNDLNYGGSIDGIGVTTGQEKVYLVFYGAQWGTPGTDANGNVKLSGDPSGEAAYLQQFLRGLGPATSRGPGRRRSTPPASRPAPRAAR